MFQLRAGDTCLLLRERWKEWTTGVQSKAGVTMSSRTRRRLHSTLKGCDRLFDVACIVCDKKSSGQARERWQRYVDTEVTHEVDQATFWSANPLEALKARVRELVGPRWAERERGQVYVPDQQGCLENERMSGGTFGVSPEECCPLPNIVRVGVAKTKGKHRVVTMQSARVKRVLTPVHKSLYDTISSFGWCVRGDVTKGDFETIADDRRRGELFVSGDYADATNSIYLPAVEAVVDVLCESEHLTAVEVETLRGSFTNLMWRSRLGKLRPIKRGSMMGNLCSFPLLCLLNKALYDICRDYEVRWGDGERERKVRINGDDIMFAGTRRFFNLWVAVTGHFGLVVNKEKTGMDGRFIDLNSRSYDVRRHRFVGKPVLSFLGNLNEYNDLLSEVVKGMVSFSKGVLLYTVNDLLRYEISVRPISLNTVPTWLWRSLIKRKWFRVALQLGPLPEEVKGERREIPVIVADPPRSHLLGFVDDVYRELTTQHVKFWTGKKVPPMETRLDRRGALARRDLAKLRWSARLSRGPPQWAFTWPAELYRFVERHGFDSRVLDPNKSDEWREDHPFLITRRELIVSRRDFALSHVPPPSSLLVGVNVDGLVHFPNGST
jgi:hypothetical protein